MPKPSPKRHHDQHHLDLVRSIRAAYDADGRSQRAKLAHELRGIREHHDETETGVVTAKLWIGSAYNDGKDGKYGLIAVIAQTKEEAVAKARRYVQQAFAHLLGAEDDEEADEHGWDKSNYAYDLLDNLDDMREVTQEVFVDGYASTRWY